MDLITDIEPVKNVALRDSEVSKLIVACGQDATVARSGDKIRMSLKNDVGLKAGQYIHIPKGSKHRIKNVGTEVLSFVEVQTGDYFGEDDIVRYQDDYNRV